MHRAQQRTADTLYRVCDRPRPALVHELGFRIAAYQRCGPNDPFVERLRADRGRDIEIPELDGLGGDLTDATRRAERRGGAARHDRLLRGRRDIRPLKRTGMKRTPVLAARSRCDAAGWMRCK